MHIWFYICAHLVFSIINSSEYTAQIGRCGAPYYYYTQGRINRMIVFNIALTHEQITQLYNLGI